MQTCALWMLTKSNWNVCRALAKYCGVCGGVQRRGRSTGRRSLLDSVDCIGKILISKCSRICWLRWKNFVLVSKTKYFFFPFPFFSSCKIKFVLVMRKPEQDWKSSRYNCIFLSAHLVMKSYSFDNFKLTCTFHNLNPSLIPNFPNGLN